MFGRRQQFVYGFVAWTLASVLGLAVLDALSLVSVYVLALVGFLLLAELVTPSNRLARWQGRLRWLAVFGLVAFLAIAAERVASMLPPGVF